jgi:hypothetical protein
MTFSKTVEGEFLPHHNAIIEVRDIYKLAMAEADLIGQIEQVEEPPAEEPPFDMGNQDFGEQAAMNLQS